MIDTDSITKPIAVVTAVMAMIGGGYSLYDKVKLPPKDILRCYAVCRQILRPSQPNC